MTGLLQLRVLRLGFFQDGDVGSASFRSVWKSTSGYFLFADHPKVIAWWPRTEMPRTATSTCRVLLSQAALLLGGARRKTHFLYSLMQQ
jgi:hypothetical protein